MTDETLTALRAKVEQLIAEKGWRERERDSNGEEVEVWCVEADDVLALLSSPPPEAAPPNQSCQECGCREWCCTGCGHLTSDNEPEPPKESAFKQHERTCPAYGNYQPPYESCTCGTESVTRSVCAAPAVPPTCAVEAIRLARRAINTWGCFARRGREQDAIAECRREVDALDAALHQPTEAPHA